MSLKQTSLLHYSQRCHNEVDSTEQLHPQLENTAFKNLSTREKSREKGARRKEDDLRFSEKSIQETLEIEIWQNCMKILIKLDKMENAVERLRPLFVGIHSLSAKQQVLMQAKKLKGTEDYKGIFLQHDLTSAQRQNMK
ncbi:hypothetical protein SK128_006503 [Halocaridina rubra]|uniref:Uncharacterized protein n=1 Tax=Halocaridina rubra TaxID=373956 RepID=A0AAN8ZPK5_HALRR